MELLTLKGVAVSERLQPTSLSIKKGEMLGIIGPNGAGKSTLLSCIAGVQDYQGRINFLDEDINQLLPRSRAQRIGYLPQTSNSAWALSVEDIVSLGRLPWQDNNIAAIAKAMQLTNITSWRNRSVAHLSGGQQARVWLARVLAGTPQILLADEPVASLDIQHQQHVMSVLKQQAQDDLAVVVSIHDLGLAARYCDTLCLLADGAILAYGTPQQVLTPENLKAAFQLDVFVDLEHNPPIILPR